MPAAAHSNTAPYQLLKLLFLKKYKVTLRIVSKRKRLIAIFNPSEVTILRSINKAAGFNHAAIAVQAA